MLHRKAQYALSLTLCLTQLAFTQEMPSSPPNQVIAAATAAFPEYDGGATFDVILQSGGQMPDPIVIPRTFDPTPGGSVSGRPTYPDPHIVSLVDRAEFVGIGVPLKRWTYPLVKKDFAVSIYLVHLDAVSITGKDSLTRGRDIYIARAGGPFTYDGHNFRAIDPNFQLFHLNESYLFFGSRIGTNVYKVNCDQTLKNTGNSLEEVSLKHQHRSYFSKKTTDDVLKEAFAAWTQKTMQAGVTR